MGFLADTPKPPYDAVIFHQSRENMMRNMNMRQSACWFWQKDSRII